jgi:menaquinone-dependent protoporphyrinogen oxidase
MRVLITVASRHGSTLQIADCIREELEVSGLRSNILEPGVVSEVMSYDAVILGSAVYDGRWLGPARKLVNRLELDLLRKPVWLFSSGPVGEPTEAAKVTQAPADGPALAERLHAMDHQVFSGKLERSLLGMVEGVAARIAGAESADDRDWLAIGAWARSIGAALKTATPPVAAGR